MRRVSLLLAAALAWASVANAQYYPPSGGSFNAAAPGPIGATTPSTGKFTTLQDTGIASNFLCTDASGNVTSSCNSTNITPNNISGQGYFRGFEWQDPSGHTLEGTGLAPTITAGGFQSSGSPTVTGLSSLAFTITLSAAATTTGTVNFSSTYGQHVSHGWACWGWSMTTAGVEIRSTSTTVAGTASSVVLTVTGSPTAADVYQILCAAY